VSRPALESHAHHGEPAQRPGRCEIGGLGDDADVRPDAQGRQRGDDRFAAPAGVLLVGDESQDDTSRHPGGDHRLGRGDQRGHAALHVGRTATAQTVAVPDRRERRGHPRHTDGVQVAVEDDGRIRG